MSTRSVDVVVVGDGPAGSALAGRLLAHGVDVLLVGPNEPWPQTFGVWADDIGTTSPAAWLDVNAIAATSVAGVDVIGETRQHIPRRYVVLDNAATARELRRGVAHLFGIVEAVRLRQAPLAGTALSGARSATSGPQLPLAVSVSPSAPGEQGSSASAPISLATRLVIDCTGRGSVAGRLAHPRPAWQTAFGVVLDGSPSAASPDSQRARTDERDDVTANEAPTATLMDFRPVLGEEVHDTPSFLYVVPVHDGWLYEETVLAARPGVSPEVLAERLAARLGVPIEALVDAAVRTERVEIEMTSVVPPSPTEPILEFGALAGFGHPATGYSVAASIRAANRVANAIAAELGDGADRRVDRGTLDPDALKRLRDAVWPPSYRATRRWHELGLEVLLTLDRSAVQQFFDAFFELSTSDSADYLRIDVPPARVRTIMVRLFRRAPWPVRRQLAAPMAMSRQLQASMSRVRGRATNWARQRRREHGVSV